MSLDEVTDIRAGIPCATKPRKFTLFYVSTYRHTKVSKLQVPHKLPVEAGSWRLQEVFHFWTAREGWGTISCFSLNVSWGSIWLRGWSSLLTASSLGPGMMCGVWQEGSFSEYSHCWWGRGTPGIAASTEGKCSAKSLEKNSTDTADGCVRLAKDLLGFIISAQKSIRKGFFSEAVIRGRILSVGLVVPWVWNDSQGLKEERGDYKERATVETLTNCSALGAWPPGKTEDMEQALAEKTIARGKQEEKKPWQLIALRASIETEPRSPGLHITQSCALRQHKALPIPYPMALSCLNSYNTTTLNLTVASWRFRISIWNLALFFFLLEEMVS